MAKTGRAGCQNTACKKAGVKIQKGEFRMGTLVTIHEHTSWMWKHWGCVTPAQIKKLQDQVGPLEDLDDLDADLDRIIDGYDEIDDESREKIKFALEHGHVADEDWNGEPEYNRPGMKGINRRTPKKKEVEDDEGVAAENEQTRSKSKAKRGRGKKPKVESEDEEDMPVSPAAKKKAARRRIKDEDEDGQPNESAPPKQAGGRKRKVAVKEEESEAEEEAQQPAKRSRTKKVNAKEGEEEPVEPVKRERHRKMNKASRDVDEDDGVKPQIQQSDDGVEAPVQKSQVTAKRERTRPGRKGKATQREEPQDADEDADHPPIKAQTKPDGDVETKDEAHAKNTPAAIPEGYIGALRQDDLNAGRTTMVAADTNMEEGDIGEGQAEAAEHAEETKGKTTKGTKGKTGRAKKIAKGRAK
ncbi:uncharacterized protein A1O5_13323 [Cladophialophora psammophila CBS 110553]|uniref:PARP-type domain-containing protein n=1 Tax=Cladophialophora psammophila CBS 110553 TaxID=1182543 RepID=W9VKA9_9EURO|nr:uncharacterized protein A1O5_13323 [Cladophialophora psammophila CBS 110553]EXJ53455.1 hypothetical protein A1O5_13323 [Cladophialophora psammophila CBS 110553]